MEPEPRRAREAEVFGIALAEMAQIAGGSSLFAQRAARAALRLPAAALARSLVALDRDLARGTLREAAIARLHHYGAAARVERDGGGGPLSIGAFEPAPREGPLLVVSNHPGLFDALALFAAIGREDLAILAARRPLFDALPNLRRRLLVIEPGAEGGVALRKAMRHLGRGGALLHFPAGRIEPDPRVAAPGAALLLPWQPGLGALLASRRAAAMAVIPAVVSGVISRRALAIARAVGRAGALTDALVPLLQLTLPGFADVDVRVRFGEVEPGGAVDCGAALRARLLSMAIRARGTR